MKKLFTMLTVLIAVLGFMTTVSLVVIAASAIDIQPTETENTIQVEVFDDFFKPETITIPDGKTTTIILKNKGTKEHTFTVKALGIDVEIQPREEKSFSITPQKPGTYTLICRYHEKEGMVGEVIVK